MRPYPEIEMANDEGGLTDFALDARSAQDLVGRVMDTYQLALVPQQSSVAPAACAVRDGHL